MDDGAIDRVDQGQFSTLHIGCGRRDVGIAGHGRLTLHAQEMHVDVVEDNGRLGAIAAQ